MTDRGRPFDDPIEVPRDKFVTLREAGHYIAALPKASQNRPEWHTAAEALL
jgi:hypothetical protein